MASRLDTEAVDRPATDGPQVVLTPMLRRHLRGVLRIEQQVYPRPWSLGLFSGELAMTGSRVYVVARIGGSVAGYSGLMVVADDGHITTVAVDPDQHGHGVATRLLLCLARRAVDLGVEQLTLEVRMSNRRAQDIYRRFGFVPAGVRRGYYVDDNEDALVMWAHDVASPAYAERLDGIESTVPGTTILEGFDER